MIIDEFQERIDEFLKYLLKDYHNNSYQIKGKIIHDSIWGTNYFYPWEIALINSPFLQRLRRIHQTGLAFLVYPTATHSRFEHSLGVTILVDKLSKHLNNNTNNNTVSYNQLFSLRLSALLHDIGHSFFSHVSELVYKKIPCFIELEDEIFKKYKTKPKGHEIFSLLMINSNVFKEFFNSLINSLDITAKESKFLSSIDWDEISGYVIGYSKNTNISYLAEIINGYIDCDKLDYLARDAKFAGPTIVYDIDRLFYTLDTIRKLNESTKKYQKGLTVTLAGINALEQIVLSRMMLFSYIYHHHKVRAAEAMLKKLCFDIVKKEHSESEISINLQHPVDFLYYTDDAFFSSYKDYISKINSKIKIEDLINRDLWVRAQMIPGYAIKNITGSSFNFTQLEEIKNEKYLNELKAKIISCAKKIDPSSKINEEDIWVDIPKKLNEKVSLQIKITRNSNKTIPFEKLFPITDWVEAYNDNKWRAYIFSKRENQSLVFNASKLALEELYRIKTEPYIKELCKIKLID